MHFDRNRTNQVLQNGGNGTPHIASLLALGPCDTLDGTAYLLEAAGIHLCVVKEVLGICYISVKEKHTLCPWAVPLRLVIKQRSTSRIENAK